MNTNRVYQTTVVEKCGLFNQNKWIMIEERFTELCRSYDRRIGKYLVTYGRIFNQKKIEESGLVRCTVSLGADKQVNPRNLALFILRSHFSFSEDFAQLGNWDIEVRKRDKAGNTSVFTGRYLFKNEALQTVYEPLNIDYKMDLTLNGKDLNKNKLTLQFNDLSWLQFETNYVSILATELKPFVVECTSTNPTCVVSFEELYGFAVVALKTNGQIGGFYSTETNSEQGHFSICTTYKRFLIAPKEHFRGVKVIEEWLNKF